MVNFVRNYYDSGYGTADNCDLRANLRSKFDAVCNEARFRNKTRNTKDECSYEESEEAEDSVMIKSENVDGT